MKSALITGGNRGIGLEICRQLGLAGFQVFMGSRDPEAGKKAALRLPGSIEVVMLDVCSGKSIREAVKAISSRTGMLDVLINNAGINPENGFSSRFKRGIQKVNPLSQGDSAIFDDQMMQLVQETNVYGPLRMIRAFLPMLRKSPEGRIINVSSGMGALSSMGSDYPAYRLSKAALNALTLMLSTEFSGTSIRVNAMCPGWVKTDMGGPNAPRDVQQGADTAVWLATEVGLPSGKFFRDRQIIPW